MKRYNEAFIQVLDNLKTLMTRKGEPFRARAYSKAQETIMLQNNDITSMSQLKGKPNIGPTIIKKLEEYLATGKIKVLETEKNNPKKRKGAFNVKTVERMKPLFKERKLSIIKKSNNIYVRNVEKRKSQNSNPFRFQSYWGDSSRFPPQL